MVAPADLKLHAGVLRTLARAKPKVLRQQINKLSSAVVRTLKRLSKNYIKGNVKLTPAQFQRVRRHKEALRELALSKTSVKRSKNLMQRGSFLLSLLAPLIGRFTSLLSKKK